MMEIIVEAKKDDDSLTKDERFITSPNGERKRVKPTKGWKILVQWKDGQISWLPLKDVKESYPVDVAEFAYENGLIKEPAIYWWAPHVLKKKKNIVAAMKQRVLNKTHKFGVEVPCTIEHALQ